MADHELEQNPEAREVAHLTDTILAKAQAFKIVTAAEYSAAGEELKQIKAAQKRLKAVKDGIINPAKLVVKKINDFFAGPETRLESAETYYKRALLAFDSEQDRIRQLEQRRLDEIARQERLKREQQAREAQARADAEAAERRRQAEAQRQAEARARQATAEEEAAGNAEAAAASRKAAEEAARDAARQDAKATQVEERGAEKATELLERAAATTAPTVQREPPKVTGVSKRENWSAEVTNLHDLIAGVADGQVPQAALLPNQKFLDMQARALKTEFNYPGVRAVKEDILAARSK